MFWYDYVACFFSGAFLTNAVPHFVQGISGNKFPTVFSKPRGQGLSSPFLNIAWAWFNILVGYLLFLAGQLSNQTPLTVVFFLLGMAW